MSTSSCSQTTPAGTDAGFDGKLGMNNVSKNHLTDEMT